MDVGPEVAAFQVGIHSGKWSWHADCSLHVLVALRG
jgi:hypothetical protein